MKFDLAFLIENRKLIIQFFETIVDAGKNVAESKKADSPGGKKVTKEEWNSILDDLWNDTGSADGGLRPIVLKILRKL